VPLGFTEGQAVQDTANWQVFRDAERVPRDDGYVVDRASGTLVPEPAFGDAFVTQMLNRERLLAEDGNYRLAELIAGFTNRPVDWLFTENSTRNRELYFRQAEAYMNSERARRMTDAADKKKQIEDLESVVNKRIAKLRETDALAADQLYYSQLAGELSSATVLPAHAQRGLATPPRSLALLTAVVEQYRVVYRLGAFTCGLAPATSVPAYLLTRAELAKERPDARTLLDDIERYFLATDAYTTRPLINAYADPLLDGSVRALHAAARQALSRVDPDTWRELFETLVFYLFLREHAAAAMTRLRKEATPATAEFDAGPNALGTLCITLPRLALAVYSSLVQRRASTWLQLLRKDTADTNKLDGAFAAELEKVNSKNPDGPLGLTAALTAAGVVNDRDELARPTQTQHDRTLFNELYPPQLWSAGTDRDLTLLPTVAPEEPERAETVAKERWDASKATEIKTEIDHQGYAVQDVFRHWDYLFNLPAPAARRAAHEQASYVNIPALCAWMQCIMKDEDNDTQQTVQADVRTAFVTALQSAYLSSSTEALIAITWQAPARGRVDIAEWQRVSDADPQVGRYLWLYFCQTVANDPTAFVWDAGTFKVRFRINRVNILNAAPAALVRIWPDAGTYGTPEWVELAIPLSARAAIPAFALTMPPTAEACTVNAATRVSPIQMALLASIVSVCPAATMFNAFRAPLATATRHANFQRAWRTFNDQAVWQRVSPVGELTLWTVNDKYKVNASTQLNDFNGTQPADLRSLFANVYMPRFSFRAAEVALTVAHRALGEFWAFQLPFTKTSCIARTAWSLSRPRATRPTRTSKRSTQSGLSIVFLPADTSSRPMEARFSTTKASCQCST
jgi:hypothetical protein